MRIPDKNLLVYCVYHVRPLLEQVPKDVTWLRPTLLTALTTNPLHGKRNYYAENRLFLADLGIPPHVEYVGVMNARSPAKYAWQGFSWQRFAQMLPDMLIPERVVAPWVTDKGGPSVNRDWVRQSDSCHPGMGKLLEELAKVTDLPLLPTQRTVWGNNFVVRTSVWYEYLDFFRNVFGHFDGKYGHDLPYRGNMDNTRKAAYFYERVTCHYFANRQDLRVVCLAFPEDETEYYNLELPKE